jgi:hypothetical protein
VVDFLASFFTLLLYSCRVRQEGEYKLWWAPSHKRMFDVSSFYRVLACKDGFPFPWMSIWLASKVPLRGVFFFLAWSATLGKILTMDILGSGMSLWSISAPCARGMGSPLTIFFSIVRLPMHYAMISSVALGCLGLCLVWLICLLVGGPVGILKVLLCGR